MSLIVPNIKLAKASVNGDKYIRAWSIIETEVTALFDAAWKFGLKGKSKESSKNYKAANYYIYLFHYAMNIDSYIERQGISRDCISDKVFSEFKINCVQDNLSCISNTFGGNYLKKWKDLATELKIELNKLCEQPDVSGDDFENCAFAPSSFGTGTCSPVNADCSGLKPI